MAFSKQTAETAGLTYGTCGREGGREGERADRNSKSPPMNLCREAIPVGEGGGGDAVDKASSAILPPFPSPSLPPARAAPRRCSNDVRRILPTTSSTG